MLTTRKAATGFGLWGYLSGGEEVRRGAEPAGLSDYYVRVHGEAWGRGAQRLGLTSMTAHQFNSLAAGLALDRRSRLVQTQNGKHCPGVDVQMSPPKSVSVELLALDAEDRAKILAAHQRATRAAFDCIEQNAVTVRVPRKDGMRSEHMQGGATWRVPAELVAYAATHWTSRPSEETERRGSPPDPQLHTHVFVMNLAWADGRFRAVDHREILRVQQYAEAVYQTTLAAELTTLGYDLQFHTDRRGRRTFELAGTDPRVLRFFSTRDTEVAQRARAFEQARGRPPTPWERQELAHATRRAKHDHHGAEPDWAAYHIALAAEGLIVPRHRRLAPDATPRPLAEREAEVTAELLGPNGLHRSDATFYRKDLAPAVFRAAIGRLSPGEATDYLDRLEYSGQLVVQHRYAPDPAQDLLTTRAQLEREATIHGAVTTRVASRVAAPSAAALARAIAASPVRLDNEQIAAAEHLARPVGWAGLEGYAGTGKTTTLAPVVKAYRADHVVDRVYAVSTAAETALRTAHKIDANEGYSVESLALAVQRGRIHLDERTLVVVDEVAMMDTYRADALVTLTQNAIVRTVGDPAQLEAIGAAGWYTEADREIGHASLTHVHRQHDVADQQACLDIRTGHAAQALFSFHIRGRYLVEDTQAEAVGHLMDDYTARRDQGLRAQDLVVVTDTSNAQIDQLNRLIQDDRAQHGELRGQGLTLTDTATGRDEAFFIGDQVVFTHGYYDPARRTGAKNGVRAEVVSIDTDQRRVGLRRLDNGRYLRLAVPEFAHEQTLRLAYAGHATRIQGGEGRVVFYLPGNATTNSHSAYSALTRGTDEIRLYASHETHGQDTITTLERRWQPGADKTTALAQLVDDIGRQVGYGDYQGFDTGNWAEPEPERTRATDGPVLDPADFWEPPAVADRAAQVWQSRFGADKRQDPNRWRNPLHP